MSSKKIISASTAEYFSKNLQQVGFSSLTKSVLTTLKEAVDNSLDACEDHGILPEITVEVEKIGTGSLKNADQVRIRVEDNGPGLDMDMLPKVFGEYLASSKFGRGRCTRGQQGIGISAATTWAQLTSASGAKVISKTSGMRQAVKCIVEVDIKNNKGIIKNKETINWNKPHGLSVEFIIDGRIQLNGEAGLLNYLSGTSLVNPHLTFKYKVGDQEGIYERVSQECPSIPDATEPHPHTMKLGEFMAHSHLFGRMSVSNWLKRGFSRVHEGTMKDLKGTGIKEALLNKSVDALNETEFKSIYTGLQNVQLMAPSTKSVFMIGEDTLGKSINRLGEVDFFSVITRKPSVVDFKPVVVEVAIARLKNLHQDADEPVQVLRFANRVPLQFDKSGCVTTKAIETVNWRSYGLAQPKNAIPQGPYVIAVSVVSPFIKFKNASKETIDSSDDLLEEIRRTLMQAGQKLSRHIRAETRASDLEEKLRHIEQFCPILIDGLCRITKAPESRKKAAIDGINKILGRDARDAEQRLKDAESALPTDKKAKAANDDEGGDDSDADEQPQQSLKLKGEKSDGKKSKEPLEKKKKK